MAEVDPVQTSDEWKGSYSVCELINSLQESYGIRSSKKRGSKLKQSVSLPPPRQGSPGPGTWYWPVAVFLEGVREMSASQAPAVV